jgi:hypothetical protein
MLGEIAKKTRIGLPGLEQLTRHTVHFFETFVAKDDVKNIVCIDERTRHVVQGYMELGFQVRGFYFALLTLGACLRHDCPRTYEMNRSRPKLG